MMVVKIQLVHNDVCVEIVEDICPQIVDAVHDDVCVEIVDAVHNNIYIKIFIDVNFNSECMYCHQKYIEIIFLIK